MFRNSLNLFIILNIAPLIRGQVIATTENSTEPMVITAIDYGICENWKSAVEANNGECSWHGLTLQCFGGMTNFHNLNLHKIRKADQLILCGLQNVTFDSSILRHFPKLRILRIEHSNLTHLNNDFPEMTYLQNINISWTQLGYTRPTLFSKLPALKFIDLRWNRLDHMDGPLNLPTKFEHLYLAGNPWNCSRNLKWLLNHSKAKRVSDRHSLLCVDSRFSSRPILTVMHFKLKLREACQSNPELRNCSCSLSYILPTDDGKSLAPMYSVNCSRLDLDHLPTSIPENTTIFYAMNNRITSVEPLRTVYRNVHDVYLDYNLVQSIDILESDMWIENFRVFSLKGNRLTKLPVYVLNNALERNRQVAKLYLSNNPWRCECIFTMRFQELLQKYNTIIVDATNVTCKYIEGDDNFGNSVLALKRSDVCKLPTEYKIQPIDLLNGVLASLIIFMLSKLAYDYYHYRKSGRLPWIVTKLP